MNTEGIRSPIDIAVSGLRAHSARMQVISNNIANASTLRTASGQPYRRKEVILSTLLEGLNGVQVQRVAEDFTTPFKSTYDPGHPQADANGYVLMPNVDLPTEMMNLISASRTYQANTAVLKRYQEMIDATLQLLR